MVGRFEWMVALRYLRARRREGFISVIAGFALLGIALGVATLIIVMAVMNGFRTELTSRVLGLSGHLGVYGFGVPLTGYEGIIDRIMALEDVESVWPVVESQALVTHGRNASGAAVRGVLPEYLDDRPLLADRLYPADAAFEGPDAIAIGQRMATRLGLDIGDSLTLIAPQGTETAFGMVPRQRAYRIVALFDSGLYEYDSNYVYMPLEAAQLLFQTGEGVSSLEVFVDDPDALGTLRPMLMTVVGADGRVWDWQQANSSFFTALQVERNVMFLILTLIIIVAAFNVISGLVMLVKDKARDIAILRTMGATRGMVMRVFLITGTSIGVVGTALGFGLGVLISENIQRIQRWLEDTTGANIWDETLRFLTEMPAEIDWWETGAVVVMSLVLSFLATLYPSWRAARLDPVEALRYE